MDTRVTEIADRHPPAHDPRAGRAFSFNQYLVAADEPLLFHTGMRGHVPARVSAAVAGVVPARLAALDQRSATSRPTSAAR